MKKALLLLIPLLLSQCANDDRKIDSAAQNKMDFSPDEKKKIKRDAGRIMYKLMVEAHDVSRSKLLKLLRDHKNDRWPINKLPVLEYANNSDINSKVLGLVTGMNIILLKYNSREQYLYAISKLKKSKRFAPPIYEKALSIFQRYADGPFPIKSIPTADIEDNLIEDISNLTSAEDFNDIISHNSKQKYDEELKKLEAEINKK